MFANIGDLTSNVISSEKNLPLIQSHAEWLVSCAELAQSFEPLILNAQGQGNNLCKSN